MKHILLLIGLVIATSTFARGQALFSKDEKEIRDLLLKMYDVSVWNNKDAYHAARDQYMDKDFIYISREGTQQGLDEVSEDLDRKFANTRYEPFAFKYLTIRAYGDTAIATYVLAYRGRRDNKPIGGKARVTKVFAKRDGKWLNILEHESNLSATYESSQPQPAWTNQPE